jgi:hypothetical protein
MIDHIGRSLYHILIPNSVTDQNDLTQEQLPDHDRVGPKHVAIDVILTSFWIKERLWKQF